MAATSFHLWCHSTQLYQEQTVHLAGTAPQHFCCTAVPAQPAPAGYLEAGWTGSAGGGELITSTFTGASGAFSGGARPHLRI